jgi:hypothetical protein
MPKVIRVIRKTDIVKPPFQRDMCIAEADNYERVMLFHLSRCDDAETAQKISLMFAELAEKFKQKSLALRR